MKQACLVHLQVQFRRAGRMAEFIVFKAGDDGIFPALNPRARRDVARDTIGRGQIVGLVVGHRGKVGRNVLADFFEIRLDERLDARGDALVGQDDDRHAVLARDVDGFNRRVKTILDTRGRNHDTR